MTLPTQLELLHKRIVQRDCTHEWVFVRFNKYGYSQPDTYHMYFENKITAIYVCNKCHKKEESTYLKTKSAEASEACGTAHE